MLAGNTPVLVHNEGGDSLNPWSNSREWTQGRVPTSGGPENGVLYRRGAGGAIVDWGVYNERGNLRYRVDLFGAAHGGVETPHWQPYRENTNPKTGKVFAQETGEAFSGAGPVGEPPCGF
nr:polymorphic toxin type 24 domain-containing protein [Salinispora pacifica]